MKVKSFSIVLLTFFSSFGIFITCTPNQKKGHPEYISRSCGSCHLTPEPSSLPSDTWESSVLPKMSEYFMWDKFSSYAYANRAFYNKLGQTPMDDETWNAILEYYIENGLSSPVVLDALEVPTQEFFQEQVVRIPGEPSVSAIAIDDNQNIWFANMGGLYSFDNNLQLGDSLQLSQQITQIIPLDDKQFYLLGTSTIDPNDAPLGSFVEIDLEDNTSHTLISGLKRPVYLFQKDDEFLISEFGFHQGGLLNFNSEDQSKSYIHNLPGTYRIKEMALSTGEKVIVYSVGQGMEGIYLLKIDDDSYSNVPLLRFPPEYGVSDFDVFDFNNDGLDDLVVVNGDNADYSIVPKGYHGVSLYQNMGDTKFKEIYRQPLHGPTQVKFVDMNHDSLIDLVVTCYFPVRRKEGILLFKSADSLFNDFDIYSVESSILGDWMVMEVDDLDRDGDEDIIIGGYSFGPKNNMSENIGERADLLILRNL